MTTALVAPIDVVLSGDALELRELPVERIPPHGGQEFSRSVHRRMILLVTSRRKLGLPPEIVVLSVQ